MSQIVARKKFRKTIRSVRTGSNLTTNSNRTQAKHPDTWDLPDGKGNRKKTQRRSTAFRNRLKAFESRLNALAFFHYSISSFSSGRSHTCVRNTNGNYIVCQRKVNWPDASLYFTFFNFINRFQRIWPMNSWLHSHMNWQQNIRLCLYCPLRQ